MPTTNLGRPSDEAPNNWRYFRVNAFALTALGGLHLVLAWVYADAVMLVTLAVGTTAGLVYAVALGALGERRGRLLGEVGLVLGLAAFQVALGPGSASALWLLPFGVATFSLSTSHLRACVVLGSIVLLTLAARALGAESFAPGSTPAWVSCCVNVWFTTLLTLLYIDRLRRRATRALVEIECAERELHAEEQQLARSRSALAAANREREVENAALVLQLARETALTRDLAEKRGDERQLVAAIHQDLHEPLRTIVSFSQLIRRRLRKFPEHAAADEYMAFAEDGGQRMARMLDDLLAYTGDGAAPEEMSSVPLDGVLGDALGNLHDLIDRTGTAVTAGALPTIQGFPTQLTQLFQNLLANAIKFARPGVSPRITIVGGVLEDEPETYAVDVADNGRGIPANQLAKVFGLFNRAHATEGVEGSGVGLALCRRIAIGHGATLSVRSVEGEGTTFSIGLPVRLVRLPGPAPRRGDPNPTTTCQPTAS